MKTLIMGTSYISAKTEGAQNYSAKLVKLWADLAVKLNPGADILIVDSASPAFPDKLPPQVEVYSLPDNIGHINVTGRDGWGRAFCKGVEIAIERGYEYIVYCDVDIIVTKPFGPIIEKMARSGVKACCPLEAQYGFLENGLMFLDVAYLRDRKFVKRYDWPSRSNDGNPMNIPEMAFEQLMEDVIFTIPMRGMRDDFGVLSVNNLAHRFPYGGPYWLTHCADFQVYLKQIELAGIEL